MGNGKRWLITGGAGYIGSHIASEFLSNSKEVIIYDSLVGGVETRIDYLREKHKAEVPFIKADIRDVATFKRTIEHYQPDGVIHTAALKSVAESMKKPEEYFDINLNATVSILEQLKDLNVHRFIFSSTAAVYGTPDHANPTKESDSAKPISPYGASKLAAEAEVANFLSSPKKLGTSLRFFNVVGTESSELSDNSLSNLVPIVINKINAYQNPVIYGTNYPTEDGTCIRDYVDVRDIAAAVFAVSNSTSPLPIVMNIGTGQGVSVRRVISVLANLANKSELGVVEESRRLGDPAILCANPSLIFEELNFRTKFTLEESLKSLTFSLLNS